MSGPTIEVDLRVRGEQVGHRLTVSYRGATWVTEEETTEGAMRSMIVTLAKAATLERGDSNAVREGLRDALERMTAIVNGPW